MASYVLISKSGQIHATSLIGVDGGCAYRSDPTYIRPQEQGKPATRELQPPVQRALYRVDFNRRSSNNGPRASSGSRPRVPSSCLLADVGGGRGAILWEEVQASYSRRHWRWCRAWCRIGLHLGGVDTVTCWSRTAIQAAPNALILTRRRGRAPPPGSLPHLLDFALARHGLHGGSAWYISRRITSARFRSYIGWMEYGIDLLCLDVYLLV